MKKQLYATDYSLENWMSNCEDMKFNDLLMPGSHDTCTYETKSNMFTFANIIQTQSLTMTDQLKVGVRYIDIRLCWYQETIEQPRQLWTSHCIICKDSLETVLRQIKDFLDTHPTEIVVLEAANDYAIFDLGPITGGGFIHTFDLDDKHQKPDAIKYIRDFFGEDRIIKSFSSSDKVSDFTSQG